MDDVDQAPFEVGTEVFAADGDKVGEVVAVHPAYVVVEKGIIFPTDLYIPRAALRYAGGDEPVSLDQTSAEVKRQGWEQPPAGVDRDQEVAVFPTGERVHLDVDENG